MLTKYPSLTKEDCAVMLANLEASLAVFDRKHEMLSVSELRVKSMLSALRHELRVHDLELGEEVS